MRGLISGALALSFMVAACGADTQPESAAAATDQAAERAAPSVENEATVAVSAAGVGETAWRAEIEAWAHGQIDAQSEGLNSDQTNVFFGDFSGDGAPDALLHAVVMGPTYTNVLVAIFRNEGGHMRFVRTVDDVFGAEPENVRFSQGQVTLTTTFMQGPDAGQSRNWTIQAEP